MPTDDRTTDGSTTDRGTDRHRGKLRGLRLTDQEWTDLAPIAHLAGVSRTRLAHDHLMYLLGRPEGVLRRREPTVAGNTVTAALEHLHDALDDDPDAPRVAVDPAALRTLLTDHRRLRARTENNTENNTEGPAVGSVGGS